MYVCRSHLVFEPIITNLFARDWWRPAGRPAGVSTYLATGNVRVLLHGLHLFLREVLVNSSRGGGERRKMKKQNSRRH